MSKEKEKPIKNPGPEEVEVHKPKDGGSSHNTLKQPDKYKKRSD
jgi:hypothetical protein